MTKDELEVELRKGRWLREDAGGFVEEFDRARAKGGRSGEREVVAEKDPVIFLARFFAAVADGRTVALGNPRWGKEEWKQVEAAGAAAEAEKGKGKGNWEGEIWVPTGGSGGRLRFARHTWETLAASVEGFIQGFGGGGVRSQCVLPLFHVSGLMQAIRAVVSGGDFEWVDWESLVAGKTPVRPGAFLSLVPTQLRRLLAVPDLHPAMRKLTAIPLGGAGAPTGLLDEAAAARLPLAFSYGATETAAMATVQRPAEFVRGLRSSGSALPHVTLRIAGPAGESLASGEIGRIRVSGRSLFHGYEPGGARPENEWHSGDLGWLDVEGRLHVAGREDRLINTGGEKVSPEEVERVLLDAGLVADVWVFGSSDREWGEAVTAVYVPGDREVAAVEMEAVLRERLALYKIPKRWVRLAAIPRTPQGKVDGRRLREEVEKLGI